MSNVFQFKVPPGVQGGQKIRVNTPNGRQVDVTLPPHVRPGTLMKIDLNQLPPANSPPSTHHMAPAPQQQNLMKVVVPYGVGAGQLIAVRTPEGRQVNVTLPPGTMSGQEIIVDVQKGIVVGSNAPQPAQPMELEVIIPQGVGPGQLLAVRAPTGQQVNVSVPPGAAAGDKLVVNMATGQILKHVSSIPTATPVGNSLSKLEPTGLAVNFGNEAQLPPYPNYFNFPGYQYRPIPLTSRVASILPPPRPSGRKKALLIGINYPHTRAALKGCINDVVMMREFLMKQGFQNSPHTMVCLVDNSRDPRFMPTKANIIKGIQWLVSGAAPGDTLFFHYSGHGAQEADNSGREADGLNETLCPCDFDKRGVGMISDDQLWDMLCAPLPNGCRLYSLMDCCHSGTGLDLSFSYIGNRWMTAPNPNYAEADIVMFSGCQDHQTSADAWSHDLNAPGGAMTTSFVNCYNRNPTAPLPVFLATVQQDIRRRGFSQVPQLTSSQKWRPQDRRLDFHDGIVSNSNEHWGKFKNQHFKPQKPNMGNSPLGPILLGAGFAVLVAPELLSGAAGLAEGIAGVGDGLISNVVGSFFDF